MDALEELLSCLPEPPNFAWDWAGLRQTALAPLFDEMARTPQNPEWHGEGDVWAHTRLVCEALTGMPEFRTLSPNQRRILALAALLHDAGKPRRTKLEGGEIISPGHAAAGAQIARRALWQDFGLCGDVEHMKFRETVCLLIQYHGRPPYLWEKEDAALQLRRIAANGELAPEFTLRLLCLLAEADVCGRIATDCPERLDAVRLSLEFAKECGCRDAPYPFPTAHTLRRYLSGGGVWPEAAAYDDRWGEVILMCGLPGTGKTSWLREHHPELPVISLDAIRAEIGAKKPTDRGRVIQLAHARAKEHLRAHRPFAWDATSLTPELRARNVALFESYGAAVRIVYLETEWRENLRRNAERTVAVPEAVINDMLGKLVPPERGEARRVDWICV